MVVSRSRIGGLGFVTDVKRLNVALTHPEDMLFIVGDRDCNADAKEGKEDLIGENAQYNDEGEVINTSQSWANKLDRLFTWYQSRRMIFTAVPAATLKQADYVNLGVAEEFRKQIAARLCKNCDRHGHKAKDCKQPKRPMQAGPDTECHKCHELGHFASACPNPRPFTGQCWGCGEMGHPKQPSEASVPQPPIPKCKELGHGIDDCTGPDRRECHVCKEPGHPAIDCPRTRFGFIMPHVATNKKQRDATKENREPPAKAQWAKRSDGPPADNGDTGNMGLDNGEGHDGTDKVPAADDLEVGNIDNDNIDFENLELGNADGNDGTGESAAAPPAAPQQAPSRPLPPSSSEAPPRHPPASLSNAASTPAKAPAKAARPPAYKPTAAEVAAMNAAFDSATAIWDADDRGGEARERHEAAQQDPGVRQETEYRAKLKRRTDDEDDDEEVAEDMEKVYRKRPARE